MIQLKEKSNKKLNRLVRNYFFNVDSKDLLELKERLAEILLENISYQTMINILTGNEISLKKITYV